MPGATPRVPPLLPERPQGRGPALSREEAVRRLAQPPGAAPCDCERDAPSGGALVYPGDWVMTLALARVQGQARGWRLAQGGRGHTG